MLPRDLEQAVAKARRVASKVRAQYRLVDFEIQEVSLVDRGANKHVFAIVKRADHLVLKGAGGEVVVPREILAGLKTQGGL